MEETIGRACANRTADDIKLCRKQLTWNLNRKTREYATIVVVTAQAHIHAHTHSFYWISIQYWVSLCMREIIFTKWTHRWPHRVSHHTASLCDVRDSRSFYFRVHVFCVASCCTWNRKCRKYSIWTNYLFYKSDCPSERNGVRIRVYWR